MNEDLVVEIKEIAPATVAYIERKGSFGQVASTFGVLYGWIGARGIASAGMPSGVYYDDPQQVPEADCRWELRAPVLDGTIEVAPKVGEPGVKVVPAYLAAATMYKGPYQDMAPTYESLGAWIVANGYQFAGPPEEVYYSDPATTAPADYLTEIRFPVVRV